MQLKKNKKRRNKCCTYEPVAGIMVGHNKVHYNVNYNVVTTMWQGYSPADLE
jgi:hypothetical protein